MFKSFATIGLLAAFAEALDLTASNKAAEDVDADDVTLFLEDFGRSQFFNPCPPCVAGNWCVYP